MTPSGTPEVLGCRRHRAVVLLAERHSPVEVARMVGVDRCSVHRWKAAQRQQGAQALRAPCPPVQACRSGESAIAAETYMNHAG